MIAQMAIYQLGAIAMPLSMLFGPEALAYRLQHSEACRWPSPMKRRSDNLLAARDAEALASVIGVGGAVGRAEHDWDALLAAELPEFTRRSDQGRRGRRADLHQQEPPGRQRRADPHRALIGNLTGFVCS
ncbi:hypothetical protein ACU4GD_12990 [Cupriavidus basilensis]